MYLVTPEQLVATPILQTIPDVQELRDPVSPNMIGILLSLVPGKRCSKEKQTHGD